MYEKPQLEKLKSQIENSQEFKNIKKYCPEQPTSKQIAALLIDSDELFYGGAGGGGKTSYLIMAALMYVHISNYAGLILMRSTTDLNLPNSSLQRAKEWLLGKDVAYNEQKKEFVFPSGAKLLFSYCEHENDKYRYKTAEFQYIGWDELTQFSERQYEYLYSRLRKLKDVNIPLRVRSASNPDGKGYDWVKTRFIDNRSRHFIFAKLTDNPHIDQESYEKSLMHLDPITRKRILHGDWSVRPEGSKFKREWFNIVDSHPELKRVIRYYDFAATEAKKGKDPDYTSSTLMGIDKDNIIYILHNSRFRESPHKTEINVKNNAKTDGKSIEIFLEEEGGASGKQAIDYYTRHVLLGYIVKSIRPTGNKEIRANAYSSYCEAGNVYLLRGAWNHEFIEEHIAFGTDTTHDDQVDSASGAFNELVNLKQVSVRSFS